MSFISFEFLIFFPVVVLLFYLAPHKFRWALLLSASCFFYMAFIPKYIFVLFLTIVIDYFAAILIEQSATRYRKAWLIVSIIANIGVLSLFKYYNFILDNFRLAGIFPVIKWALPIGLSFHTFQSIAYTVEVYRKNQKAERHFGIYALYIMFFPQLVAGPIERPQHMLPQFHEKKIFNYTNATSGLRLILWGFFKKIVIADRLAIVINHVYDSPGNFSPFILFIATFFFAFQIYCDFSAYSDIAVGTARCMGFRLVKNFNFPYQSRSLPEFWQRWHISLSSWFKDYLYIPLGGNRVRLLRWCFNILFVFILSGFWHGANWTFIVWGALNGFYFLLYRFTKKYRQAFVNRSRLNTYFFYPWLETIITFSMITVGWIFFRAGNMHDALVILQSQKSLFTDAIKIISLPRHSIAIQGLSRRDLLESLLLIAALITTEIIIRKRPFNGFYLPQKRYIRWATYYALIILIIVLGVFENKNFIYFQF